MAEQPRIFGLGDLQRFTGATRLRLTHWTKIGLLRASVQRAAGPGTRQLFSWEDLCTCGLIACLDLWGIKPRDMKSILDRVIPVDPWALPPPNPKGAGRDLWLLVDSVPDEARLVRAASLEEAIKRRPRDQLLSINLSGLQRVIWGRVKRKEVSR